MTSPVSGQRILEEMTFSARLNQEGADVEFRLAGDGGEQKIPTAVDGKSAEAVLDMETLEKAGATADGKVRLYAGETLLEELRETQIQVVYGIDKNAENIYSDISILSLEDTLDDVDAIVVTAVTFFDEIEDELHKKVNCPILSLEDILYEV